MPDMSALGNPLLAAMQPQAVQLPPALLAMAGMAQAPQVQAQVPQVPATRCLLLQNMVPVTELRVRARRPSAAPRLPFALGSASPCERKSVLRRMCSACACALAFFPLSPSINEKGISTGLRATLHASRHHHSCARSYLRLFVQKASEREEVQEEVGEECGKFGKVEGCAVPEPPQAAVRWPGFTAVQSRASCCLLCRPLHRPPVALVRCTCSTRRN